MPRDAPLRLKNCIFTVQPGNQKLHRRDAEEESKRAICKAPAASLTHSARHSGISFVYILSAPLSGTLHVVLHRQLMAYGKSTFLCELRSLSDALASRRLEAYN